MQENSDYSLYTPGAGLLNLCLPYLYFINSDYLTAWSHCISQAMAQLAATPSSWARMIEYNTSTNTKHWTESVVPGSSCRRAFIACYP